MSALYVVCLAVLFASLICGLSFSQDNPASPDSGEPRLAFAFEAHVQLGTPLELGTTPYGERRIIPIIGGTFEGPAIKGSILPGGADWQVIRPDGLAELDARYTLRTDKGALIYVVNTGMRHGPPDVLKKLRDGETVEPSLYYFRTTTKFETSAAECQWLTRAIFVASGVRHPDNVVIRFWRVL